LCIIWRPITPSESIRLLGSASLPHQTEAIRKKTAPHNETKPPVLISWPGEFLKAAPVKLAEAGLVELAPTLDEVEEVAVPFIVETRTKLDAPDVVTDTAEAVNSGVMVVPLMPYTTESDTVEAGNICTVVVLLNPYMMALADTVGLVVNTNVELSLVIIHWVVIAGLL
jgi:hypothetical protein